VTPDLTSTLRRDWTVAALTAGLAWLVWIVGVIDPLERPVADLLLRAPRPGSLPASRFAAVVIDDSSVDALGPLPWPRDRLAALVETARDRGARALVLDVLLSEPAGPAGDARLEQALSKGPAVLAAALAPSGSWLLPLDRFGGVRRSAHVHAEISSDGVVRSIAMTKQADGLSLPALAVAAATLAGWEGAAEPGRLIRPDFRRPPGSVPQIDARSLLAADDDGQLLAGRVVWLGVTAAGAGDQFVVPVGSRGRPDPGVLVHAAAADALLRGGLVRPAGAWLVAALTLAACGLAQWMRTRRGRLSAAALGALAAVVVMAAVAVLWTTGLQLPMVTVLAAMMLSVAAREVLESSEAQRETAAVLEGLIEPDGAADQTALPRGVVGRLQLALTLQQQIVRDRDLRRTLLEGLGEGVALWDPQGRILLGNAALASLWGGMPSLHEVSAADGGESSRRTGPETIELERHGRSLAIQLRTLDLGTLGLVRDTTAERELERRRRETQRMVSHELKTPLASISGFGAMLERYELDRDEQLRVAGMIRGEADRLGRMVATFLDLERLGSGRFEAVRRPVDLAALATRRCDLLGAAAAERSQRIEVDAPAPATVIGAEELLDRLVDNLVGNAIKYSPEGAVVTAAVEARPEAVILQVRDRGPGIPDQALPHLFERFFRVPGSDQPGTGLGLALVREVADWHGAEVRVDSAVGRGSTFTVIFAAAIERSEADGGDGAGS
jgi:signal transduction histidine kinase